MDTAIAVRPEDREPPAARDTGIDLLRIVAVLFICLSHATQTALALVDIQDVSLGVRLILRVLSLFGEVGNLLFVICSSFFLCDKHRSRLSKVLTLLLDCSFISTVILCGFLLGGYSFDPATVAHQLFPTINGENWFVPCYIVFYLFSPIIGIGLRAAGKKGHLIYCITAAIVFGVTFALTRGIGDYLGCRLVEFFLVFGFVSYIKWHAPRFTASRKANLIVLFLGLAVSVGLHVLCILLARYSSLFSGKFYSVSFRNPVFVLAMIALFNLFNGIPAKNRFISYLGSCTLFVYIIHENYLLRTYTRVEYYRLVVERYGTDYLLLWGLLCGVFMFVVGFLLAAIYGRTIHRFINWVAFKASAGICSLFEMVYLRLFQPSGEADDSGGK